MSASPTLRQLEVLAFVHQFRSVHGYSPSIREIGTHFGIASTKGVSDHLRALLKKGLLLQVPNIARTLAVSDDGYLWLAREAA